MDPLNDIEDEEFARTELGHVSSVKQKKMPKNEGGGIVFSDCNVDIHTLNNYLFTIDSERTQGVSKANDKEFSFGGTLIQC